MSQSETENDPAEIIEGHYKIQVPRCWRQRDIVALVEMWHEITGDSTKRPSQCPGIIKGLTKLTTAVEEPPAKKNQKQEELDSAAREQALKVALNRRMKLHIIRHFTLENPDSLVAEVYGNGFKKQFPLKHSIVRRRMLNMRNQIKYTTLDMARQHVEAAIESGGEEIKACRDADTIRQFFAKLYSKKNFLAVFGWIEPILDLDRCAKRVHSFLHNTYANLCTFVKFNLHDQYSAEWGRAALILYWDRLGKPEVWKKVRLEHFAELEPRTKKGKSKLVDKRNYVHIDDDDRFGIVKGLCEESSDFDSDSDYESDGIVLVAPAHVAAAHTPAEAQTTAPPDSSVNQRGAVVKVESVSSDSPRRRGSQKRRRE